MNKNKLSFGAEQHPAPEGVKAIDSIRISPHRHGILNVGQFSLKTKPKVSIVISSARVNNEGVEYYDRMLGNEEKFQLIFQVDNHTDSIAFAYAVIKE